MVATLASLFAYTTRQGWTPTSPATGLARRRPRSDRAAHARARAIPAPELLAFLDADHPLRDKPCGGSLYEAAARARARSSPSTSPIWDQARRGRRQGRPSRGHRLGDQDCPLLPRHLHRLASLAICAKPTFDAVAAATGALDPDRRR